jgi:hypothetical protein
MKCARLTMATVLLASGLMALASTAPGATELINPLAVTPLDRLSDTRERPLFAPNRRKPPPEVVAAPVEAPPPPPPAPPKLSLFGIVQDDHGARAIVKPAAGDDDKTLGLRIGDHVEGWSVTAIDTTKLTLSLEERSVVFSMFDDSGPSDQPKFVRHHMARVIELNAAGVLTARRVGVPQP